MIKKFFYKVVLGLFVFVLTASYTHAQITFGARVGLNLTNMSFKYDGKEFDPLGEEFDLDKVSSKFKPGIQIGLVGDYALSDELSIQPGILFAQQGYRVKESLDFFGEKVEFKASMNLNYLQIPINFQYKMDLSGMNLLLQAGPYLGYGFGGKMKFEVSGGGESESDDEKITFGSGEKDFLSPLDLGLGLGAGLQFDNIQVGLGYNIGLANIKHKNADSKASVKNSGLALTVTYLFGN